MRDDTDPSPHDHELPLLNLLLSRTTPLVPPTTMTGCGYCHRLDHLLNPDRALPVLDRIRHPPVTAENGQRSCISKSALHQQGPIHMLVGSLPELVKGVKI